MPQGNKYFEVSIKMGGTLRITPVRSAIANLLTSTGYTPDEYEATLERAVAVQDQLYDRNDSAAARELLRLAEASRGISKLQGDPRPSKFKGAR